MELYQLEYVIAVAKYQSFTRAAEEINTSQSALSQQISKLEHELSINLFVRTTRSVQLTPAGAEFVGYAKRIMAEVTEARKCIDEYVTIEKGHLLMGIIPVIGYYPLPSHLLASFQKDHPGVQLSLLEEQDHELLRLLHAAKIDAAIIQNSYSDPRFTFHPILNDQMVLVISDRHPLAARKAVHLSDLRDEKFIVTPPTSRHHQDFYNACLAAGFEPNIKLTCSAVRTMMGLVLEDLGVTVLSSYVARKDWQPGLSILSITPMINRQVVLAVPKNGDLSPSVKLFVKFTAHWLKSQAGLDINLISEALAPLAEAGHP